VCRASNSLGKDGWRSAGPAGAAPAPESCGLGQGAWAGANHLDGMGAGPCGDRPEGLLYCPVKTRQAVQKY